MSAVTPRPGKPYGLHVLGFVVCAEVPVKALSDQGGCSSRWMGDRDG
jgi:hypothetical protein